MRARSHGLMADGPGIHVVAHHQPTDLRSVPKIPAADSHLRAAFPPLSREHVFNLIVAVMEG